MDISPRTPGSTPAEASAPSRPAGAAEEALQVRKPQPTPATPPDAAPDKTSLINCSNTVNLLLICIAITA